MKTIQSRKNKFFLTLAVIFFSGMLSGCLGGGYWVWQHPEGLPNATLQQAKTECRQLSQQQIDRFDYYYPRYFGPYYDSYHYRGHRSYYWRQPHYDFFRYNRDLDRLYNVCMQAKGWQLIYYENPPPPAE